MDIDVSMRVARPTDSLADVVRFYTRGLGLTVLAMFEDHDGFDGVIVGTPGAAYHLEFTHKRGHAVGNAPTQDNLLAFYLPDTLLWRAAVDRMQDAGYVPVTSFNPYWDRGGLTFEDPDGYKSFCTTPPGLENRCGSRLWWPGPSNFCPTGRGARDRES